MNNRQQTSACRVVSIASGTAAQSRSELARICGTRAINLAEMAESIRANRDLCYIVTEAACKEFGWRWLSVEDSIVLLGVDRLGKLLSNSNPHGRSATEFCRTFHNNGIAASTRLCLLETFQGETK
jgi:hypothetical protein